MTKSSLFTAISIAILFGCLTINAKNVKMSKDIGNINSIKLEGHGNLYLKQGDSCSLIIETNEEKIPHIKVKEIGNTLYFDNIRHEEWNGSRDFINYYLTVKDINKITKKGWGNLIVSELNSDEIILNLDYYGKTVFEKLLVNKIEIDKSGYNELDINFVPTNILKQIKLNYNGWGEINIIDLNTDNITLLMSNSGNCTLKFADNNILNESTFDLSGHSILDIKDFNTKIISINTRDNVNSNIVFMKNAIQEQATIKASGYSNNSIFNLNTNTADVSKSDYANLKITGKTDKLKLSDTGAGGSYNDSNFTVN
jgi:hypothetical protein